MSRAVKPTVVLALILVGLWTVVHAVVFSRAGGERIKTVVVRAAGESLAAPLTLRKLDIDPLGRVVAVGVRIGAKRPTVSAERIVARFSLTQLALSPRDPAAALKSLTIVNPVVRAERGADGVWNLQRLLKPPAPGSRPPRLKLRVKIVGGAVEVSSADGKGAAFSSRVEKINGKIGLDTGTGAVSWKLSASSGFANKFKLSGRYASRREWFARISAPALDIGKIPGAVFPRGTKLSGRVVRLDARFSAPAGGRGAPGIEAGATLAGVNVVGKSLPFPIVDAVGAVKVSDGVIEVTRLRAGAAGGRVEVSGAAALDLGGPVSLRGEFVSVSARELAKAFAGYNEAGGSLSGTFSVSGAASSPFAEALLRCREPRWGKAAFDSAEARLIYSGGRVAVSGAKLTRGGGVIEIDGALTPGRAGEAAFALSARAEGIRTADAAAELGLGGGAGVRAELSGGAAAVKTPGGPLLLSGNLRARNVEHPDVPAKFDVDAAFNGEGGDWNVESLLISAGRDYLAASGAVGKDGGLDLQIEKCDAAVERIAALLKLEKLPFGGRIEFAGRIGGALDAPDPEIDFSGHGLAFGGMRGLALRGRLDREGDRWESSASLSGGSMSVGVDAYSPDAGKSFEARVDAVGLPLKSLSEALRTAGLLDVSYWNIQEGAGDFRFNLSGAGGKIEFAGRAEGRDLRVYGESVRSAEVEYKYGKELTLSGGRAVIGGDTVRFSGVVTGRSADIVFGAASLELSNVNMLKPYKLTGRAEFGGRLGGEFGKTVVTGGFSPARIEWRKTAFDVGEGAFEYRDGILRFEKTEIERGAERYHAWGAYDLATRNVDMTFDFEKASPATFQDLFGARLWVEVAGELNGSVRLIGVGGEPAGTVRLESDSFALGDFALTRFECEGKFRGLALDIERLYAHNELSQIKGEGMIDLTRAGESLFNLEATSVDLDVLGRIMRLPFPASGLSDIYVEITGDTGEMFGSIDAWSPSVAGLRFDRMRGRFSYADRVVTLQQFSFLRDGAELDVRGTAPLAGARDGEKLQIVLNGKDIPLSLFNPYTEKAGFELKGALDFADAAFTEDSAGPRYSGTVSLDKGEVRYAALSSPFTDVTGALHLEGDVGALDSFTAMFGGKKIEVTGGAFFKGRKPEKIDVAFSSVKGASIDYAGFYRGLVDVENVSLTGSPLALEIRGVNGPPRLKFYNGTADLARLPAGAGAAARAKSAFSLLFRDEIRIEVGGGVMVKSGGNLKLYPEGSLQLGGSMAAPALKGALASERGYIRPGYSDISFSLVEPAVIGFYSPAEIGAIPIFYAHGKARVSGLDVYVEISGPMIDIESIPAYREFCADYLIMGADGAVSAGGSPRILVGGAAETAIPVCPGVRLYAYEDNNTGGAQMPVQTIMKRLTRADEIEAGAPMSQILIPGAVGLFTPEIGTIVEQSVDLENFELNLDPNKDLLVELEKRLLPKLYVRMRRLFFSQNVKQEVEFRYQFRKKSYILWNVNQDNEQRYEVEYRYTF